MSDFGSEVFKDLIEVLIPEVAKRVYFLTLANHIIFLDKRIVHDAFCHRHVDVHRGLHRYVFLQLDELVVSDFTQFALRAAFYSGRTVVTFIL